MRTKKWKKVILPAALLAVSMLFAACGKKTSGEPVSVTPAGSQGGEEQKENTPTPGVKDDVTPIEEVKNDITPTQELKDDITPTPEIKDDITPTPAGTEDGENQGTDVGNKAPDEDGNGRTELLEGYTWGGVYASSSSGLACEFNSDWRVRVCPLEDWAEDSEEEFWDELWAENKEGTLKIVIDYFRLSPMEQQIFGAFSEEAFADLSLTQKSEMEKEFKAAGFSLYRFEKKKVMLCNEEHFGTFLQAEDERGIYYKFVIESCNKGKFLFGFSVSMEDESKLDEVLAMFSKYEISETD